MEPILKFNSSAEPVLTSLQASEEVKIKKVEQEIIYSYLQKRNELCPICFAMVSRHGEARISEYQYKEVLNSETWLFASGISETLVSNFRTSHHMRW